MVIAAGMPNRAMSAAAVYPPTVVSQGLAGHDAQQGPPVNRQPANTAAASASHLTCCRSSRPPARYRTASDNERGRQERAVRHRQPIEGADGDRSQDRLSRFSTPSGFGYTSDIPPGAGSCSSRGVTTSPVRVSARPPARSPAAATGSQRRDSSVPVGKRRNMNPGGEGGGGEAAPLGERAHLLRCSGVPRERS